MGYIKQNTIGNLAGHLLYKSKATVLSPDFLIG
jgi:hypothetical protein